MISSIVAPASRFSNTSETGMRVSLNTQAPLTLPAMLSTAGHCDQSRVAMRSSFGLYIGFGRRFCHVSPSVRSLRRFFLADGYVEYRPRTAKFGDQPS